MRRFITSSAALALLMGVLGCHHTAGMCDCDHGCGNGHAVGTVVPGPGPGPAPVLKAEPLKVMPKSGDPAPTPGK